MGKKPLVAGNFDLTEKIETNAKAEAKMLETNTKFQVVDKIRLIKHKSIFSKGCSKKLIRKVHFIISVLKATP